MMLQLPASLAPGSRRRPCRHRPCPYACGCHILIAWLVVAIEGADFDAWLLGWLGVERVRKQCQECGLGPCSRSLPLLVCLCHRDGGRVVAIVVVAQLPGSKRRMLGFARAVGVPVRQTIIVDTVVLHQRAQSQRWPLTWHGSGTFVSTRTKASGKQNHGAR